MSVNTGVPGGGRRVVVRVDPGGGVSAFFLFNLPDFHCFWYPAA